MKFHTLAIVLATMLLAGCGPLSLSEIVPDTENEILYHDVVEQRVLADEISYFGVMLGASEEDVVNLHGQPDSEQEFAFGRTKNIEYSFGQTNDTTVLYHFDRGVLNAVLITSYAQDVLEYDSLLGDRREDMYSVLRVPTVSDDLASRERMFVYDEFGYELFTKQGIIQRIYFTTPNRGIEPAGRDADTTNNTAPIITINQTQ